jgi:hypothetical protein
MVSFISPLVQLDSSLWSHVLMVDADVVKSFQFTGDKMVICTLNDKIEFQCAIMPHGNEEWFINLNAQIRNKLGFVLDQPLEVKLKKDDSEFGLPVPEELEACLLQDLEGKGFFDELTPGKKRNLLYIAGKVKNPDKRIQKSLVILEHLKKNKGIIDFKQLNFELKLKNNLT